MAKLLYDALQFFARWLQQPTIVEVAGGIDVRFGAPPEEKPVGKDALKGTSPVTGRRR